MLIVEVLDATIVRSGAYLSIFLKVSSFISITSGTASITRSASFTASLRVTEVCSVLLRILSTTACSTLPFLQSLSRLSSIRCLPLWTNSSFISHSVTSYPLMSATWAMPWPIAPAPITVTFVSSSIFIKHAFPILIQRGCYPVYRLVLASCNEPHVSMQHFICLL